MTLLTLELPPHLYERLRRHATTLGKTPEQAAERLLDWGLTEAPAGPTQEREQVTQALRAAGLLTTLTLDEKRKADATMATGSDVRAALDRAGGKPLSEVIIEMRGPKE